jgi:hypothetical protein
MSRKLGSYLFSFELESKLKDREEDRDRDRWESEGRGEVEMGNWRSGEEIHKGEKREGWERVREGEREGRLDIKKDTGKKREMTNKEKGEWGQYREGKGRWREGGDMERERR